MARPHQSLGLAPRPPQLAGGGGLAASLSQHGEGFPAGKTVQGAEGLLQLVPVEPQ